MHGFRLADQLRSQDGIPDARNTGTALVILLFLQ
jgi:hypothetical protein